MVSGSLLKRKMEDIIVADADVLSTSKKWKLTTEQLLRSLQTKGDAAKLICSPESPAHINLCMEEFSSDAESSTAKLGTSQDSLRDSLIKLFSIDTSAELHSVSVDDEEHCKLVVAALSAALPFLKDVLPRDQCGTCVVPHPHPLKQIELDERKRRTSHTGVVYYETNRVCDNCDERIDQKRYWNCGEMKASGHECSVDFCMKCYDEMQALFATCSIENAMWVVRFINSVSKHVLAHMSLCARQLLVRHLAFEFPLAMFESLVRIVVDVTDASIVHIEDNIASVAEFEEFWYTLGFLDLLHAANLLPSTERRAGEMFLEGARLPNENFVLQGIDKCEAYSDWRRWRNNVDPQGEMQSNVLDAASFAIDDSFTCFLSHSSFVPRSTMRKAVEYDVHDQRLPYRKVTFRREPEAFFEDIVANLGHCFEKGDCVRLHGLKSAADLNGKEGILGDFDQEKGRWCVTFDDDEDAPPIDDKPAKGKSKAPVGKSLKPINLEHADSSQLDTALRSPFDTRFAGENGSGPGVMKEFFGLALQSLISRSDCWEYNEEVRTYWFKDSRSPETIAAHRALGAVLGKTIWMGMVIPAIFPDPLESLLLRSLGSTKAGKWSLADLRKVSPEFARSFEQLLEYDKDDIASVFTLDWPRGDELATLPKDSREGYVQAYVEWFFDERFKPQVDALCQGFGAVVGHSQVLRKLVSVEQFGQILHGIEEPVDFVAIRRKVKEVGWSSDGEKMYLETFWEILNSLNEEQRRKFVVFVSSSARAPLKGWSDFSLQVQKNGTGDDRFPTAYTCFQLLLLPMYSSTELLRTRLLEAIDETQGFGLY